MGRFRTLARKTETESYNDYYQKQDSKAMLKFARSIANNNKSTDNFSLCCCKTSPINTDKCYIAVFQSYASLIKLLKQHAYQNKDCTSCADVPLTLMNGLKSEICFDEFYKSVDHYSEDGCSCLNIRNINHCTEKLGRMYPYGYFNNDSKSPNISLKRKLYLTCDKKKPCPAYVFCKCSPTETSCKCCDYNVVFPHNDTFLSYTISGCNTPEIYEYFNNPTNNPSKSFNAYNGKVQKDKLLQKTSTDVFSKYNVEL